MRDQHPDNNPVVDKGFKPSHNGNQLSKEVLQSTGHQTQAVD